MILYLSIFLIWDRGPKFYCLPWQTNLQLRQAHNDKVPLETVACLYIPQRSGINARALPSSAGLLANWW